MQGRSSRRRLVIGLLCGVAAAVVMGATVGWSFAALAGWDVLAFVLVVVTWLEVWPLDPETTARHAVREEPGRAVTQTLLMAASLASLVGVGFLVTVTAHAGGSRRAVHVILAVATVVASWAIVHTTFMLRYARLYYSGPDGGVTFWSAPDTPDTAPRYSDFAYLAVTIGMTFQVSDTNLTSSQMRATALRHSLLSYLYGVVIIAVTINLLAGLTK
jgi:uncharacterized membrane protein